MPHVTWRLTANNRDQLWNTMLGNRVWATFTFLHHYIRMYIYGQQQVCKFGLLVVLNISTSQFITQSTVFTVNNDAN